jgi:hypothetical protein
MIDLLTVVFDEEIDILRVQAQSIDLYCENLKIKNIFVVVNDHEDVCQKININWWGAMSDRVKILHRSNFGSYFHDNGWISQQYLKLKASTFSENKWVMVLDAKCVFVKKMYLRNIFDIFGRIKLEYQQKIPYWYNAFENVNLLFDIKLDKLMGIVPYMFEVDLVVQLIDYVEEKTHQPFERWFQSFRISDMSEIILYFGFVLYKYKYLIRHYTNIEFKNINYNLICVTKLENANGIFESEFIKKCKKCHIVMIHRKCWAVLTDQNKDRYKSILISRGLDTAKFL